MASTPTKLARQASLLQCDPDQFHQNFDRHPFQLTHSVSDHPLLEVPRLITLARFLKNDPHNTSFDVGEVGVEERWNKRPGHSYSLEQALERIDNVGAWVILKHTESDPEYRQLMLSIISEVERLGGRNLTALMKNLEAQIMLTSPNRVTPYHLDNECNFLLQIRGEKDLFVFDQSDREVLTEGELERFWVGDWNAGEYKARCQERSHCFRLAPGRAVHIPVNAPHWVRNDRNVSVSISINFEWLDEKLANVYRANYFLRRAGLTPQPPGNSRFKDRLKGVVIGSSFVPARNLARDTVRFLRRIKHARSQKPPSKPVDV